MKIVLNKLIYYLEKLDITEEKGAFNKSPDYFGDAKWNSS
jgi:hypothetical protein